MKTYFSFLISVLLTLMGCAKNNTPTGPGSESSAAILLLSGQVDGWSYGSHRIIALTYSDNQIPLHICSSSKIDSFGRFSLQDISSPSPSSEAFPVYPSQGMYTIVLQNTFMCSDSSARLISGALNVATDTTSSSWVGFLSRASFEPNETATIGDFVVSYYFVTKDVKLSGTIKARTYAGIDTTQLEEIIHYDLSLKKGWNQQITSLVSQSNFIDSNKTIRSREFSLGNYEPYQGKWIYYGH